MKRTRRRSSGSRRHQYCVRRLGGDTARPNGADGLAGDGWVEGGGELIWAVGFTEGGAPFGLRVSDFDPADLEAMGFPGMSGSRIDDNTWAWLPESDPDTGYNDAGAHVARGHVR